MTSNLDLLYLLIICEIVVIILLSVSLYNEKTYIDDDDRQMSHMTGYYQGYREALLDIKNRILSKGGTIGENDVVDALDNHDEIWSKIFKKYKD